jgi:mannose-6-phosphate isomerase-like protein (cupin superfamily)
MTMPTFTFADCPKHYLRGTEFTTLATPSHGNADVRVWRVEIQPDTPAVPHSLTRTEVFVIQQGEAQVRIGEEDSVVREGDVIVVPAETPFALHARGGESLRAIVCFPLDGQAVLPDGEPFTPPWGK